MDETLESSELEKFKQDKEREISPRNIANIRS